MKRTMSAVIAAFALAGLFAAAPVSAAAAVRPASVCEPNGTGCTKAGTYGGLYALISDDFRGFRVAWTSSVVYPYSSGVPGLWTAYVTFTNTGDSPRVLDCTGNWDTPASVGEYMYGGSGDDGGPVTAASTTCGNTPNLSVQVAPGGKFTVFATFGNVPWPGSSVIVALGSAGFSPAVYPFGPQSATHLSGYYTLGRTVITCTRFSAGCSTAPFPVHVTSTGNGWQIMNTSGLWNHPLALTFSFGAWRASGSEPQSTCDGARVSDTKVSIVLEASSEIVQGVAVQLIGTLEGDQGPTACNNYTSSIGRWELSTPAFGAWPGTGKPYGVSNGPYYSNLYYGYSDPNPKTTTVCQPDGTGCVEDTWDFFWGQCTSWVAYRLNQLNGIKFSNSYADVHWGNASQWEGAAQSAGFQVNGTPAVGSVAWWNNSSSHVGGHVAYVEEVYSPTAIAVSEMNYDDLNGFRIVFLTTSSSDWPDAFLHIADR